MSGNMWIKASYGVGRYHVEDCYVNINLMTAWSECGGDRVNIRLSDGHWYAGKYTATEFKKLLGICDEN